MHDPLGLLLLTLPWCKILHQFRSNNQSVAVVLDRPGRAVGIITLDGILEEFWPATGVTTVAAPVKAQQVLAIDKSFPGDMKILILMLNMASTWIPMEQKP